MSVGMVALSWHGHISSPGRGRAQMGVHQVLPGVPRGLAFMCLLAADPGALVAAPFSFVLLAASRSGVGGHEVTREG
jgi:hypothetical protein